jgi:rhamnosyltransferase
MIKVAILLAAYNGKSWLQDQLLSILSQRDVQVYIFISDDYSEDGTWEYLLTNTNERVTLLPRLKRYGTAGQNFFRLFRDTNFLCYDYIALADQDDIWNEDKLSKAISLMVTNLTDAASSNVTAFWNDGKTKILDKSQSQARWDHLFEAAGPGCTYVLSRNVALALQQFLCTHSTKTTNVVLHDWLIYAWVRHHGYHWSIDPSPSMQYRQHSSNQVGANTGWTAAKARFSKIRSGWYRDQALLIANLIGASEEKPIQLLARFHFTDKLTLAFIVTKLRRRWRDRFAFVIGLFITKAPQKSP